MLLRDEKDPDAWKDVPTWDGTPIMPPSCKPLSFFVRSPLGKPRPQDAAHSDDKIEPISLPPAKYVKPKPKPVDPSDHLFEWVDGHKYLRIDGVLLRVAYEKHPGPQSIYPPAWPVPGISKKPRGRSVPTKDMGIRTGTTYTCEVEGCRKVFVRSEHLKRHVRSLHMPESDYKYMCALPFCSKTFARRDNLMQHERKHKDYQAFFDCSSGDFNGIKQVQPQILIEGPMPRDLSGEPWWAKYRNANPQPIQYAPIFDDIQGFPALASGGPLNFAADVPTTQ